MSSAVQQNFVPMAVVGMGCKLPGASNLDEYWSLLYEGRSGIKPFPEDRFNQSLYYSEERGQSGRSYCKVAGIVDYEISEQNSSIINEEIRQSYDLCQVTLLDVVLSAVSHAGWKPERLAGTRTGVFVGNSDSSNKPGEIFFHTNRKKTAGLLNQIPSDLFSSEEIKQNTISELIETIGENYPSLWETSLFEYASNAAAALITETLKTQGPSMALDAACASSSVALLAAQHALKSGRIDSAIVGGASFRTWCELVILSQIQSIGTGQSCPFDALADGFIGADGFAAVILKTLDQAVKDGDRIFGVIRSIGLSSDGRGKSFWAPRMEGQSLAIQRAYEGGLDPSRLQYLEAHATSTQVGDATEIRSLMDSIGPKIKQPVPIGSVKANIGHSLETAGLASLIKVLLGMENGFIPPSINISNKNPDIEWDSIPFYPPANPVEWQEPEDGHPRRAGIDVFGIGGLNSHLVVDQFNENLKNSLVTDHNLNQSNENDSENGEIAVIGMGCLFPGAYTVQDFWNQILSGESGIHKISEDREFHPFTDADGNTYGPEFSAGYLKGWEFDWKKHKIPPKQVQNANPLQFMVLDAAVQAFADAGYAQKEYDRTRIGTVVGTIFSSNFCSDTFVSVRLPKILQMLTETLIKQGVPEEAATAICEKYQDILLENIRGSEDESASYNSSTVASRITKVFDLMGGAFSVDSGDASSLAALNVSIDLLNNHVNDVVICAAGHQRNDQVAVEQYVKKKRYSSEGCRSPFDSSHDGIVPGEGAAVVILKRLEDAKRDGDRIYGVINRITSSSSENPDAAFENSIRELNSTLNQGALHSLEMNGRSSDLRSGLSKLIDSGGPLEGTEFCPSAMVSQFGDLGGVASMAALIKNLKIVETGVQPGIHGVENLDSEISRLQEVVKKYKKPIELNDSSDYLGLIVAGNHNGFLKEGANVWTMLISSKELSLKELHLNRDEIGNILVRLAVEQSGFPPALINLNSSFEYDLHWNFEDVKNYLYRVQLICGLKQEVINGLSVHELNSINTLLERIENEVFRREVSTEKLSVSEDDPLFVLRAVESSLVEEEQTKKIQSLIVYGTSLFSEPDHSQCPFSIHTLSSDLSESLLIKSLEKYSLENPGSCLLIDLGTAGFSPDSSETGMKLVRKWISLDKDKKNSLVALTRMGGDFGLSGRVKEGKSILDCEGAISLIRREKIPFKLIDFSGRDPDKLVKQMILSELRSGYEEVAIGLIRGRRHVLRAIPLNPDRESEISGKRITNSAINIYPPEVFPDENQKEEYRILSKRIKNFGMIENAVISDSGKIYCGTSFSPLKEPFLDGHRSEQVPLLPAVIATETMAEAACVASRATCVNSVRELKLINGFWMPEDHRYYAEIESCVDGRLVRSQIKGDFYKKDGEFVDPHRLYQSAQFEVSDQPSVITPVEVTLPDQGDWIDVNYASHWTRMHEATSDLVYYGPEMRSLKQILPTQAGLWSRIITPQINEIGGARAEGCQWVFPSALFDSILFSTDLLMKFCQGSTTNYLPSEVEYIQLGEMPEKGETLIGWTQFRGEEQRKVMFDAWLFRKDGSVVLYCQNCTMVKMPRRS